MRFSNAMLVVAVTLGLTLCCAAMPREMLAHQDIDAMFEPSKQVLSDGRTRVQHNYHFTHPEHGTYVKKNMQGVVATHKYAFVNLDSQAESVQFSAVEKDMTMVMTIVTPSSTLRAELLVRTLSVVVVGTQFGDSQGRHVMHHVLSVVRSDSTTIVLKVTAASYDQLFEELSVSYNTNHVLSAGDEVTPRGDDIAMPATGLTFDHTASRKFAAQGIFDWIKQQFSNSNILETVKQTIKSLGLDLFNSVKITLLTGSLNFDKNYGLGQLSYNRNVNTQWQNVTQKWSVTTGPVRFGASALLDMSINLGVNIASYKFVNQSLSLVGSLSAEVSFQATPSLGTQASKDRMTLTTLAIKPLSFSIASVSIQLTAQLPIYGGYDAQGAAPMDITTTFSATGTVKIGYVFDNTVTDPKKSKFSTFCTPAFQYTGNVGGNAAGNFAANAFVEPVLLIGINFIGGGSMVFHLGAETTITVATTPAGSTPLTCPISVVMIVQPLFTVSAKIDIQVLNTHLYGPQEFGPNDVYTKTLELVRLCSRLPQLPGRVFKPSSAAYEPSMSDLASVYSSSNGVCGSHQVSLQVGDVNENGMTMYANVENHQEEGVFTTQQQFAVTRTDRKLSFAHVPSSLDYRNDARQEFITKFDGELSADGDSISLHGFAGCPEAIVSRSKLVTIEAKPSAKKGVNAKTVLPAAIGGAGLLVVVAAGLVVVARKRAAQAAAQEQLVEATA